MRERLDNSLVASMDTSAEKVLQFLGQEEDMLDQHKDRCTKLMEYQVCLIFYPRVRVRGFTETVDGTTDPVYSDKPLCGQGHAKQSTKQNFKYTNESSYVTASAHETLRTFASASSVATVGTLPGARSDVLRPADLFSLHNSRTTDGAILSCCV